MTDMPTTYDTHTTTTSSGPSSIGPRMDYIKTIPGILKIVEMVLDLLVFICACVLFGGGGGAWVRFVSMSAFISTLIYFLLHFLNIIARFGQINYLIEFIYYCVFSVFYLIAAIVAASYAKYHSSIAACTFFAFAATAIYAVDTYFQFRAWRTGQAEMTTTQTSTTTTTVHSSSHVEAKTTY